MESKCDFADIQALLAAKETGPFHLASRKLNPSRSVITGRDQKLEGAEGSDLFERTTRMVRLTLAAKRLQARVEPILDDVSVDIAEDYGQLVQYDNPDRTADEIASFFK